MCVSSTRLTSYSLLCYSCVTFLGIIMARASGPRIPDGINGTSRHGHKRLKSSVQINLLTVYFSAHLGPYIFSRILCTVHFWLYRSSFSFVSQLQTVHFRSEEIDCPFLTVHIWPSTFDRSDSPLSFWYPLLKDVIFLTVYIWKTVNFHT